MTRSRPQVPIEDLLSHRGQQYQQRAQRRVMKQDLQAQILRDTPKLNPVSERIVLEKMIFEGVSITTGLYVLMVTTMMNLSGESSEDRLSRPIGALKQKTLENIDQPTFQPTLSKKSQDMVQVQPVYDGDKQLSSAEAVAARSQKW